MTIPEKSQGKAASAGALLEIFIIQKKTRQNKYFATILGLVKQGGPLRVGKLPFMSPAMMPLHLLS